MHPYLRLYYSLRPYMPRGVQLALRKMYIRRLLRRDLEGVWPIDRKAGGAPEGWTGWPDGKDFSLVLTHDVEWGRGHDKCQQLATLEEEMGFRSSFNFVPERYKVSSDLRANLTSRGFEVGVHGLNHDGKLYNSRELFEERARKINQYLHEWKAVGFRSPSMHHNLDWIESLDIEYDASTFDTDPFEPQSDGEHTIFPFWHSGQSPTDGYVELPYTLPQDALLFVVMERRDIDIWKKKLDWIVENGGMALINTHPDYMHFGAGELQKERYPSDFYKEFLEYVRTKYSGRYWHALPRDTARFWRERGVNKTKRENV